MTATMDPVRTAEPSPCFPCTTDVGFTLYQPRHGQGNYYVKGRAGDSFMVLHGPASYRVAGSIAFAPWGIYAALSKQAA
jgi:hypothetical protein